MLLLRASMLLSILGLAACWSGKHGTSLVIGLPEPAQPPSMLPDVVLDLGTGSLSAAPAGTATPAADRLVFRVLPAATVVLGSSSNGLWLPDDGPLRVVSLPPTALAAVELSRAQWLALGGSDTWSALGLGAVADDGVPAVGMSRAEAEAVLAAASARLGRVLRLPRDDEWEYAARGSSARIHPWGDDGSPAAATGAALLLETGGALAAGPRAVSEGAPTEGVFYNLAGNIAEMTVEGHARGGCWLDGIVVARGAFRFVPGGETGHPAIGLRVLLAE